MWISRDADDVDEAKLDAVDVTKVSGGVGVTTGALEAISREILEQKTEAIRDSLLEGHDGVDFVNRFPHGDADDFSIRYDVVEWEGSPPAQHDGPFERVDFRYYDRRELARKLEIEQLYDEP